MIYLTKAVVVKMEFGMAVVVIVGKEERHVYQQAWLNAKQIVNNVPVLAILVVVQDTAFLQLMAIIVSQPRMLLKGVPL